MKNQLLCLLKPENILTFIVIVLLRILHCLPFKTKIALGRRLGRCIYKVCKRRVHITKVNVQLCFPHKSQEEQDALVYEVFENFGVGVFETAMSWWTPTEKIYAMTDVEGKELLEEAQAKNKGVILLGAHFTILDLSAVLVSKYFPVTAIYRDQTNAVFNAMILKARRKVLDDIITHRNLLTAVKRIKQGKIVWYAPDQDMGIENSVFAPFFGHPAATLGTTAKLAKITDAPIVMMSAFRKPDNSGYLLRFTKGPAPFPLEDDVENATAVNQVIEDAIRYDPSQYSWFHRRFKSQPDTEKGEIYTR